MERARHRRTGLSALASLALAWLALSGGAAAQDDAEDPSRDAFSEGVTALRDGDLPAAAAAFRRSYTLRPRAAPLCNLALTYDRWEGHPREALQAYEACAREDDSGRFTEHATTRAAELRAQLAGGAATPPPAVGAAPDPFIGAPEPEPEPEAGADPAAGWSTVAVFDSSAPPPPAPRRSHGRLFGGIGLLAGGAALFAGGLVLRGDVVDIERDLSARYADGAWAIPATAADGSRHPDARRLDEGERKSTAAVALYALAGGFFGLGALLVALDLSAPRLEAPVAFDVSPTRGGAVAWLRARLF